MAIWLFILLLQGQLVFGQVPAVQDCVWNATSVPSIQTFRYDLYSELKAIPETEPVFQQFRIWVITMGTTVPPPTNETPAGPYKAVIFQSVETIGDFVYSSGPNEQSCIAHETAALAAMVALNSSAVDAVLTKYVKSLDINQQRIWPRP
jgi:hypothetical protein